MFGKEKRLEMYRSLLESSQKELKNASYQIEKLESCVTENNDDEIMRISLDALVRCNQKLLKRTREPLENKYRRMKLPIVGELIYILDAWVYNSDKPLFALLSARMKLSFYSGKAKLYMAYMAGYNPPYGIL